MADSEDVWDSWEDMVDSGGLDKRLEEEQKQREAIQRRQLASHGAPIQEDTHRTAYQPQLRILKRPTEAGGDQGGGEAKDVGTKTKHKTLAEREEEYKQARLRILGSADTNFTDGPSRSSNSATDIRLTKESSILQSSHTPSSSGGTANR